MSFKLIQDMLAAGCTAEQMTILVKGLEEITREINEREERQREQWRERQRRYRMSRIHNADVTVTSQRHHKDLSSPDGFPPSLILHNTNPPSLTPSLIIAHFDAFWTIYPKKVGKGQAMKAWKKAITKAEPEAIISACKAYPWPSEREFIPHASTWLNGERWLDEQPKKEVSFLSAPLKPIEKPVEAKEPEMSAEDRAAMAKRFEELLKGLGSNIALD